MGIRRFTPGIGLCLALAGTWTAAAPVSAATAPNAGRLARQVLISRHDLGPGWTVQAAAPSQAAPLTCPVFRPATPGVVRRAAAASPTFAESQSGPFVSQTSYVYGSAAQERIVWTRVVRPALARCFAAALVHGGSSGVSFAVTATHTFALGVHNATVAGYRVEGTASGSGQSMPVVVDSIVLGRGRTISALSLSSFDQAPSRGLESRLAALIARRTAGG